MNTFLHQQQQLEVPYNQFEDFKNNQEGVQQDNNDVGLNVSIQQNTIIEQLEQVGIQKKYSLFVILTQNALSSQQVLNFITTNEEGKFRHYYLSDKTDAGLCRICGAHQSVHLPIDQDNNNKLLCYPTEGMREQLYHQICKLLDPQYISSEINLEFPENLQVQEFKCYLCNETKPLKMLARFQDANHDICNNCFIQFLKTSIVDNKKSRIKCPHCQAPIQDEVVYQFSEPYIQKLYIELKDQQQDLIFINCPFCQRDNILESADIDILKCINCQKMICTKCHALYKLNHHCDAMIQIEQNNLKNNLLEKCIMCNGYARRQKIPIKQQICPVCNYKWCKVCRETYTILHDNNYMLDKFYCPSCSMNRMQKSKVWAYRISMIIMLLFVCAPLLMVFGGLFIAFKKNKYLLQENNSVIKKIILFIWILFQGLLVDGLLILAFLPAIMWFIYQHFSNRRNIINFAKFNIQRLDQ